MYRWCLFIPSKKLAIEFRWDKGRKQKLPIDYLGTQLNSIANCQRTAFSIGRYNYFLLPPCMARIWAILMKMFRVSA